MRAVDVKFVHSSTADIGRLTAQMSGKAEVEFADLRNNVSQFANLKDGELAQIAQDAGFEVQDV